MVCRKWHELMLHLTTACDGASPQGEARIDIILFLVGCIHCIGGNTLTLRRAALEF